MAGYRYATVAETQNLLRQMGFPIVAYSELPAGSLNAPLATFDSLLGLNVGNPAVRSGFTALVGDPYPGAPNHRPFFYAFIQGSIVSAIDPLEPVSIGATIVFRETGDIGLADEYLPRYPVGSFLVSAIPEPGQYALIGVGLAAIALVRRRRSRCGLFA